MTKRLSILITALLLVSTVSTVLTKAQAADWPTWRGTDRTDISTEKGLLQSWPEGGPKQLWTFKNAGKGYSSFAIANGTLYTLGTRDGKEILIALDAETGKDKVAVVVGDILSNNWGDGPRGTPTVAGGIVYAMGGGGSLIAADSQTGVVKWKVNMSDFGGKKPGWGYCESVTVEGDQVICTPGGSQGAMVALRVKDGSKIWQSSGITDGAQYASILPIEHNGRRQYVQLTQQHVFGVDAQSGKVIWKSPWEGRTAVVPTPIHKDGHVYISSGYGVGCKLVKLENGSATEVYRNQVMKNHHGGVLLVGDYLYGYSDGPGWLCQNFKSGEMVWNSKNLGKGAVTYADGRLYAISESDASVVLLDASPDGYQEHGRFKLGPLSSIRSDRGRVWTHPVISNGKLYLRDQDIIYCYDITR
jgi:outer membrane protein assembly factor BamB